VPGNGLPSSDRRVVEQAKSHRVISQRVMTRRASQAAGSRVIAFENSINRIARCSGGTQRDVERFPTDDRVGFDSSSAVLGEFSHTLNVTDRMNASELLDARGHDLASLESGRQFRRFQMSRHCPQPVCRFGMPTRFMLQKNRVCIEKCHSKIRLSNLGRTLTSSFRIVVRDLEKLPRKKALIRIDQCL
jgi:hypothetical protein